MQRSKSEKATRNGRTMMSVVLFVLLVNATPLSAPFQGETRTDSHGIEQVKVPAGVFLRGTADITSLEPPAWARRVIQTEQPQHEVEVTRDYWIDMYEVTNAAYGAFVLDGGYQAEKYWSEAGLAWLAGRAESTLPIECEGETNEDHPRVCVTWYEAEAYASWRGGRLPTEAEWEYAARGPESLIYPWGNEFDPTKANVLDSSATTAVGSYETGKSWVGAYDMAGNAMEWVQDWLGPSYYSLKEKTDPQGPDEGRVKVEKGGWWGSNAVVARSAYHHFEDPPTYQDHHIGFRIVSPVEEPRP